MMPPELPQQPAPAPVDVANQLLAEGPAQLSAALMSSPTGQRLALTVRTTSATVTVLLSAADAKAWASTITRAAGQMSASGLVIAGAAVPAVNGDKAGT